MSAMESPLMAPCSGGCGNSVYFCTCGASGSEKKREDPNLFCRCGHATDDHDAAECWARVDADDSQCRCSWYEPVPPDPDPDKIVGWTDDEMYRVAQDLPGCSQQLPDLGDPGPDPYGEPEITTVNLPGDRDA